MSPADAWQRSGMPSDRPSAAGRSARFDRSADDYGPRSPRGATPPSRGRSADRSRSADRMRAPERDYYDEPSGRSGARRPEPGRGAGRYDRGPVDRHPAERYPAERGPAGRGAGDRRPRSADPRGASARRTRGEGRPAETGSSRLRGSVAVAGIFVLTLVVAGAESFLGVGLGTVTLVALVLTTVLAALLVRRRDLVSVIVSPPLLFVAVAVVDVAAAPSATLNLATLATLLIRGFPAMAIATGAALVIGLIRMAARR